MKNNTLILTDEKTQLKNEAFILIDKCKEEIRDFSEDENNRIIEIRKRITEINTEIEEIRNNLNNNDNKKENKLNKMEFRLIKAINDVVNNRQMDECTLNVVNKGIEEMRKSGVSYSGQIQLPVEMRDITVEKEGEDVVSTDIFDILEPLRAKNVLVNAGAKFLTNLVGDVQVPVMTGSNVHWEGETATAKDGEPSFDNVKLQPKRITAFIDISKQFLVQDSLSAESMLRADLVNAINSKLEATILGSEAGTTTKPEGIFNAEELTTIASFKDVCELEADIEDANVIGECSYIMSNKAKATLRNMPKSTKSTELVMQNGTVDGTKVFNTSNVEGTNVAYGDFSQLAIGQWGACDIVVDPYTVATEGKVRIVVNAYFDAKVLRDGAIAVAKV